MGDYAKNLLIAEPSHIVSRGLIEILDGAVNFRVKLAEGIQDICRLQEETGFEIAVVNPSLVQNSVKEFAAAKKIQPGTIWIGLIYSFFSSELLEQFDKLVYINDTPEKIAGIFRQAVKNGVNTAVPRKENLTKRETEVLKLLAEGNSNKEIANKLNISINTVITHRKNITQKTEIKTLSGLTIYAVINKIISIES